MLMFVQISRSPMIFEKRKSVNPRKAEFDQTNCLICDSSAIYKYLSPSSRNSQLTLYLFQNMLYGYLIDRLTI